MPGVCLASAPAVDTWFAGYEQTYLERDTRQLGRVDDALALRWSSSWRRGGRCWAIEVKAGCRWTDRDLTGLRAFLQTTPDCRAAILADNGSDAVPLGDRLWAMPASQLLA